MDSTLDRTNAAMIKKALKTFTDEQLAYALDSGVRLLDTWRIPAPMRMLSSDGPADIVYPLQLRPTTVSLNRAIRNNRKQSSQV